MATVAMMAQVSAPFARSGHCTEFVREIEETYTAQALIMTDKDNNQSRHSTPAP